jgi:hypothetical protein
LNFHCSLVEAGSISFVGNVLNFHCSLVEYSLRPGRTRRSIHQI